MSTKHVGSSKSILSPQSFKDTTDTPPTSHSEHTTPPKSPSTPCRVSKAKPPRKQHRRLSSKIRSRSLKRQRGTQTTEFLFELVTTEAPKAPTQNEPQIAGQSKPKPSKAEIFKQPVPSNSSFESADDLQPPRSSHLARAPQTLPAHFDLPEWNPHAEWKSELAGIKAKRAKAPQGNKINRSDIDSEYEAYINLRRRHVGAELIRYRGHWGPDTHESFTRRRREEREREHDNLIQREVERYYNGRDPRLGLAEYRIGDLMDSTHVMTYERLQAVLYRKGWPVAKIQHEWYLFCAGKSQFCARPERMIEASTRESRVWDFPDTVRDVESVKTVPATPSPVTISSPSPARRQKDAKHVFEKSGPGSVRNHRGHTTVEAKALSSKAVKHEQTWTAVDKLATPFKKRKYQSRQTRENVVASPRALGTKSCESQTRQTSVDKIQMPHRARKEAMEYFPTMSLIPVAETIHKPTQHQPPSPTPTDPGIYLELVNKKLLAYDLEFNPFGEGPCGIPRHLFVSLPNPAKLSETT